MEILLGGVLIWFSIFGGFWWASGDFKATAISVGLVSMIAFGIYLIIAH